MPIIKSLEGKKVNTKCIGCDLQKGKLKSRNLVHKTKHFEIRQDYEIPIAGFFVIASKRHIKGIGELTKAERTNFIELLHKLRKGMENILKIKYIQILHREDKITSKINPSHFHIALLPKKPWMSKHKTVIEILKNAKKNPESLKKIDLAIKKISKLLKDNA